MAGDSQGSSYPELRATHCAGVSQNHCLNCANTNTSCACRSSDTPPSNFCQYRPRVRISDARRVRDRVESHASHLRLRGARKHVLQAVLWLLCDHKRITDDRVHLHQIVWRIVHDHKHRYDPKTVGRALASLAADKLITYQPARGRGRCAVIAIHEQFAGDIKILDRDSSGRVLIPVDPDTDPHPDSVTFSSPAYPSIEISKNPPTPHPEPAPPTPTNTRPTEVAVNPDEVRRVRDSMPSIYRELPSARLRWLMGAEIARQLARGYRPDQILAILDAPLPPNVDRPWKFAQWRFAKNIIGPGPRLEPLQRAWDKAHAEAERQTREAAQQRSYTEITEACDQQLLNDITVAVQHRFGESKNPQAGVVHAGRLARRQHPDLPLHQALSLWAHSATAAAPHPTTTDNGPTADPVPPNSTCVSCQNQPGTFRAALPIPELAVVCDDCWTHLADPELQEDIAA